MAPRVDDSQVADRLEEIARLQASVLALEKRNEAIREIAAAVGSSLDLREVLEVILDRVTELMDADRSSLFLKSEDGLELVSQIAQGREADGEIRLRIGEGIAGWVASTGRTLNIKDAYKDPRFNSHWDQETGYVTGTILCVPLRNLQRRVLGVLQVLNKGSGYFTVEDEELLHTLAGQAAVTLENAKLFADAVTRNVELLEAQAALQQKLRELDALFEVEQSLHTAVDVDLPLEQVLRKVTEVLDAEAASILLHPEAGEAKGSLKFRAAVGPAADRTLELVIPPGEGIVGWVAVNGRALRVDDVKADPRHASGLSEDLDFEVRNEVAAPVVAGDVQLGAISVLNKQGRGRRFSDDDLKLLCLVAGQVGAAIRQRRQREAAEKQARLADIGHMLSGIVHDLKAPMTLVGGYAQLMVNREEQEQRLTLADKINAQFERMSSMTNEILAFARGESQLLVRKVFLSAFVEEVAETLSRETEGLGIALEVSCEDRGVAWFDAPKIQRVIQNLCRNAIDAMPQGGELYVGLERDDNDLILEVRDTGGGVPEEIRDRLFESFVTTGKERGTGLGLAIVRKVVEDHGGSVRFRSRSGDGTTFVVRLPQPEG